MFVEGSFSFFLKYPQTTSRRIDGVIALFNNDLSTGDGMDIEVHFEGSSDNEQWEVIALVSGDIDFTARCYSDGVLFVTKQVMYSRDKIGLGSTVRENIEFLFARFRRQMTTVEARRRASSCLSTPSNLCHVHKEESRIVIFPPI